MMIRVVLSYSAQYCCRTIQTFGPVFPFINKSRHTVKASSQSFIQKRKCFVKSVVDLTNKDVVGPLVVDVKV